MITINIINLKTNDMKKTILTLLVSLLVVMVANALDPKDLPVVDTLPERLVNGLKITPIRTTYRTGEIFWKLRVPNFDKSFQKFESKYPGVFSESESKETMDSIYNWREDVWNKIVSNEIKTAMGECERGKFKILLYINKEGEVFAVEFLMMNEEFQKLNTLPQNMMRDLYHNLLKEKCNAIKQCKFCYNPTVDHLERYGKDYIIMNMDWYIHDLFGTDNPTKLQEMLDDGRIGKIFEKRAAKDRKQK